MAKRKKPRREPVPPERSATRRQQLEALLGERERTLEELTAIMGARPRDVEEDLRHLARSVRAAGGRLVVTPARCRSCDFVFRDREARHLHAPSRCPLCREERIEPPAFRVLPPAGDTE